MTFWTTELFIAVKGQTRNFLFLNPSADIGSYLLSSALMLSCVVWGITMSDRELTTLQTKTTKSETGGREPPWPCNAHQNDQSLQMLCFSRHSLESPVLLNIVTSQCRSFFFFLINDVLNKYYLNTCLFFCIFISILCLLLRVSCLPLPCGI